MGGRHVARDAGESCRECGAAPLPGQRRCAEHAEAHRARSAKRRATLLRASKCSVCARAAVAGLSVCSRHREYYRARDQARRAEK